mmetsp:Transcript_13939/g.24918  ORF Transcript_13939/g.24918 Transcript_13939/m.24918 type:complete len:245 (+) Transcript_13939:163-897(+)
MVASSLVQRITAGISLVLGATHVGALGVSDLDLRDQSQLMYPVEVLPQSNRTVFGMEYMANGGLQIVALGRDGQVWHVYQNSTEHWSDWMRLTDVCPSALDRERKCIFDGDPAIGRNEDGRLEVFMRFRDNLDLWQIYQTDVNDPSKWSMPREGSCVDQNQTTAVWSCLGEGFPDKQSTEHYFIIDSPAFTTSNLVVLPHPKSGKIQVFFRNFEGHMYKLEQVEAGDSTKYSSPQLMTSEVLFI